MLKLDPSATPAPPWSIDSWVQGTRTPLSLESLRGKVIVMHAFQMLCPGCVTHGLPQAATGPGFASAVGLSLFAAHPQDEWWDFDIPADRYPARSLKRAVKWFRDNW